MALSIAAWSKGELVAAFPVQVKTRTKVRTMAKAKTDCNDRRPAFAVIILPRTPKKFRRRSRILNASRLMDSIQLLLIARQHCQGASGLGMSKGGVTSPGNAT